MVAESAVPEDEAMEGEVPVGLDETADDSGRSCGDAVSKMRQIIVNYSLPKAC